MPDSISSARRSLLVVIAGVAALAGLIAWVSSIGGPHDARAGLVSVVYLLVTAGPPVLAYMLGAIGLGSIFRKWTRSSPDGLAIESCLGLALMLSLSHGLGVLGLLRGSVGVVTGGGVVLAGIVLLARRILAHGRTTRGVVSGTIPWPVVLGLPALAVLVTAACSPPGWLWDSEHRGYDALSYHLQLPQEWIEVGRIWPNDHNVYSYLPGYVESAFYHIAAMSGAPTGGRDRSLPIGLLAGEGHGVITCQLLHAAMAVFAAVVVGRMAMSLTRCGREVGALTGVLFLSVPWVIVTGSLAYNEMGVAALFAAAVIAAGSADLRASRRGLLSGLLVGIACGCKPTALFMCAPVAGLILISRRGLEDTGKVPRRAIVGVAWASTGGLVAIAPWLIRNWITCGNPVFPMGASVFGAGPWSVEQVHRYAAGHTFDGSLTDRVLVLFSSDRGLLHPQWALLPAVGLAAWVVALVHRRTHMAAAVLGLGVFAQVVAWLLVTHLQSRFLLPLAVTGCGVLAAGLAALMREAPGPGVQGRRSPRHGLVIGVGSLICIGHAGITIGTFSGQSKGKPNISLLESPWFRTGELERRALAQNPDRARELAEAAPPEVFVNVLAPPGTKVYLIGEARGLYYTCPMLYNVTWDKWPLGEAMRSWPGKPAAWTQDLWDKGVRLVLVNAAEIDRLQQSGWADPMVTNEAVNAWLQDEGRLVRSWPEIGVGLFELKPPGAPR
jgi:hypothetical protein